MHTSLNLWANNIGEVLQDLKKGYDMKLHENSYYGALIHLMLRAH
jgi:hypothetical protein